MLKTSLCALLLLMSAQNFAQVNSEKSLPVKDSAALMAELMDLLSEPKSAASEVTVGLGFSNRLFSARNNALNAKQSSQQTLLYSPSINYYHKTGISVEAGASLLSDSNGRFGANQYSLGAAYQLQGQENIDWTMAYTHYFIGNHFSDYAGAVENEWYTSLTYKKIWLQPGISLGYASGKYGEVKRKGNYYDSITTHSKSFYLTASVAKSFQWYGVVNKKDGLNFIPSLMLNMGSSTAQLSPKTNAPPNSNYFNKLRRLPRFQTSAFGAESFGLSLDMWYSVGKVAIAPRWYMDYYLGTTSSSKLTNSFSLQVAYSF